MKHKFVRFLAQVLTPAALNTKRAYRIWNELDVLEALKAMSYELSICIDCKSNWPKPPLAQSDV